MATFSQGFLSSLGRPQMAESLFGLGQAIGGVPGQMRQRRQQEEFNQLMQQAQGAQGAGDITSMKLISQQMANAGYTKEAGQLMQAATALEQKNKQQAAVSGLFEGTPTEETVMTAAKQLLDAGDIEGALRLRERGVSLGQTEKARQAETAAIQQELQGYMMDPKASPEVKRMANQVYRGFINGQMEITPVIADQLAVLRKRAEPKATGSRAAPVKFEVLERQPDGSMAKVTKFAIQQPDGSITYETGGLAPPKEFAPKDEVTRGDIAQSARKQWQGIMEQSSKASTSIIRTNDLIQRIQQEPSKATGIISEARTVLLDTLGLRDAEEANKTAALREINSKIVGDLPPGVASDRDIAIFSQGFPTGNASTEEILEYLQIEARFLAIAQDKGILAEQFLEKQMAKGQDATFVGFLEREQAYSSGLLMLERLIQDEVNRGVDPVQAQRALTQQFQKDFGFVPSFYR